MPDTGESDARKLAELREKIDAIDAEMHRLLIDRGTVIDALIRSKGTSRPGAAFRPGREADMMRRLVARHSGALPLATVEHIWREIIATFTRMQAPYDVAVDMAVEPQRMQDLARFTFGFSVELIPLSGPAAVIARVAEAKDLGLIARDQPKSVGPWWRGLGGASAPRIMALLPHIGAAGRPADLPAFVISPPLADPTPPDVRFYAASFGSRPEPVADTMILAAATAEDAIELLIAAPADLSEDALSGRFTEAEGDFRSLQDIGGTARGMVIDGTGSILYQGVGQEGAAS